MKTLKFRPHLVQQIIEKKKTTTWRLFDDKDLQIADELIFINKDNDEEFGTAKITDLKVRTLGTLTDEDWVGHEKFKNDEEMFETYKKYYGDKVNLDSEVKIIYFDFKPKV